MNALTPFLARVRAKEARVGVLGLGYVGLPLVRAFVEAGFRVLGFDNDPAKITLLKRGETYIGQIPGAVIQKLQCSGLEATNDLRRLGEPDVVLLCLPTPLTELREPDLSAIVVSAEALAQRLRRGQLIVLESTTYPGTTREILLPVLERSGLRAGQDFFLAYSPERHDPGNTQFSLAQIPKIVSGINAESLDAAMCLYTQVVANVVRVSSPEIAEATKLLENTYRAVNIALVNELKVLCDRMGLDVWEVIDAAKTKPFGFQAFYPGPGLGGHCIPIDPFYLAWLARRVGLNARFVELAGEINMAMPHYVVDKIATAFRERGWPMQGSRVLLLGMAYKKDVDDPRESPGFAILDALQKQGVTVTYNDPHIPVLPVTRRYPQLQGMASESLKAEILQSQHCVVIVTDHSVYDWPLIVDHSRLVIDTRNATRHITADRTRIVRA